MGLFAPAALALVAESGEEDDEEPKGHGRIRGRPAGEAGRGIGVRDLNRRRRTRRNHQRHRRTVIHRMARVCMAWVAGMALAAPQTMLGALREH